MIYALEGPDRCGKSTTFAELEAMKLHSCKLVQGVPMYPELMPVLSFVEARQAALWAQLYDDDVAYVCDRHVVTSAFVYDQLFRRPMLVDIGPWLPRITVVYFDTPLGVLEERYRRTGDPFLPMSRYNELIELYEALLKKFAHVVVDGTQHPRVRAEEVVQLCNL